MTTNLPFLRWLVAHPALRAGETTTAFLVEHPPLSRRRELPTGPWRGPFRLNLRPPPAAPPPDLAAAPGTARETEGPAAVTAPMPGTVLRVLVAAGDRVEARQPLVVLEAMKMETPLLAPYDADVGAVHVEEGDTVAAGACAGRARWIEL